MTTPYILVADDDPSIRELVGDILRDEGYTTKLARNGSEALNIARNRAPALVVLDMRMPVVDGWEFASRLRVEVGQVPVLVMTAAATARQWAEQVAADGYLAKPFDLEDFIREVRRLTPPPEVGSDSLPRFSFTRVAAFNWRASAAPSLRALGH